MAPDPREASDLDSLAALAAGGDERAEGALFADLRERFVTLAKRRVREDEIDDCVQEALAIAHARYRSRRAAVRILPWSLTVMRNVIGNTYQRRERAERHEPLQEEGPIAPATASDDPLDRLAGASLRAQVVRALVVLGRDHPRCAALFRAILKGLARGDDPDPVVRDALAVAREEDPRLTRGNLHVILHRCRGRLRRMLEGATT